eukprot:TRINITY_DN4243_c0_g1_i1.p1 TRINITY_DN4243_c0_g1~~TRINITY_DN4243_c0_g1_i1.p1  ORF type:complete len:150 (-),score=46.66 TRINITY_DN4243_c0_g1_i1:196-645(-)
MSDIVDIMEKTYKEIEILADSIMHDKELIVDIDRKRNKNREGMRYILNKKKEEEKLVSEYNLNDKEDRIWLMAGEIFFKLPESKALDILNEEQSSLDEEIYKAHKNVTSNVAKLDKIEKSFGGDGYENSDIFDELKPLTKEDKKFFNLK